MNSGAVFLGIIPLLIFVIVDSFAGPKTALISAVVLCLAETVLSYYLFHELDSITLFSFFLVVILAFTSYRLNSAIYFKLQPVILSVALGVWFISTYMMGNPLLVAMTLKYQGQLPAKVQDNLQNPLFIKLLALSTIYGGFAFILHGLTTAYAAYKLSNWWWIALRGIGFYFFFFLAFVAANLTLSLR